MSQHEAKSEIIGDRATEYPHLALCVLDAVWTPGVSGITVRNVVSRYCAFAELSDPFARTGRLAEAPTAEPLRRFVDAIERDGAEGFATDTLQNRQRTLGASSILKAEAAYRVASLLQTHNASYPSDVVVIQGNPDFEDAFRAIPGLGPAALTRLYTLCGLPESVGVPISAETSLRKKRKPETVKVATIHSSAKTQHERIAEIQAPQDTIPTKPASNIFAPSDLPGEPVPVESPPITHRDRTDDAPASFPVAPATTPPEIVSSTPPESGESPPESVNMTERYNVRITEMPPDERPRERLAQYGAEALGHAELIAILLRTGTEKHNAVQVAERLLADFDGLRGVAQMTLDELSKVHGIGLAKAAQIKAAIELGRRLVAESPDSRYRIRGPQDVYNLLGPRLRDEKREHFIAVLLDTKGGVIRQETISIGDLSSSIVNPREVYRPAVRHAANSLIVAHNHPSGDPTPSPEDVSVTRLLLEAGKLLSIELLDHVILGDNRFQSLKEKNLI